MNRTYTISLLICTLLIFFFFWVNQSVQVAKASLIIGLGTIYLFAPSSHLFFITLFLALFSFHLRYFGTSSNAIILLYVATMSIRGLLSIDTGLSLKRIFRNPFFIPSVLIFFAYLVSWILAFLCHHDGMNYHTHFLVSIFCAFLLSNAIIGFVDSPKKLLQLRNYLLVILILNLAFAALTLVKPDLKFLIVHTSGVVFTGPKQDFRLGGLVIRSEAYGEYLMMAVVFLANMLCTLRKLDRQLYIIITLMTITSIELLLTNTRGAILSAILGIMLAVTFFSGLNPLRKIAVVLALVSCFIVSAYVAESTGYLRLKERFATIRETVNTKYGKLPKARAMTWVPAVDQIIKDRFSGFGPSFYPLTGYEGAHGKLVWPHNIVLLILATVGLYGFAAYFFLFFRYVFSLKAVSRLSDHHCKVFYKSIWLALLMFLIDSQKFDGALRKSTAYFYFIWILLSVMFTSFNLSKPHQHIDSKSSL